MEVQWRVSMVTITIRQEIELGELCKRAAVTKTLIYFVLPENK